MADEKFYADGWVQLSSSVYLLPAYWLNGFPTPADEKEARARGRGPDLRVSPIFDYRDGGIGALQWVNVTHNAAAIVAADGDWRTGGTFHLWISPGAGTLPYEVGFKSPIRLDEGDPSGWQPRKDEAEAAAVAYLGLRPLQD